MITKRTAVQAAKESLAELYEGLDVSGIELEEMARSDDGKSWTVLLSFDRKRATPPANPLVTLAPYRRMLKYVSIDGENGEFLALKDFDE